VECAARDAASAPRQEDLADGHGVRLLAALQDGEEQELFEFTAVTWFRAVRCYDAAMSTLSLEWLGDLKFRSGGDGPPIELHSSTPGVLSPMHALGYGVLACMAMDVAHVLGKGRHDLKALTATFDGDRAPQAPRRYTAVRLHFDVTGDIADEVVSRAIELSRTTYCSALNSLRTDIDVHTSFTIHR
jgi:putative redox protein